MFNSIIPNIVKADEIIFKDPKYIIMRFSDSEDRIVSLEKGASNYLYNKFKLKESTSKEVYKKSIELWERLLCVCENESTDSKDNFYLNKDTNIFMVTDSNELIDVFDAGSEELYDNFESRYEEFKLDISEMTKTRKMYREGSNGLIKLLFYRADYPITEAEYTPVIILEANPIKSTYKIYTGIYLFSKSIIIPNLSVTPVLKFYHDLVNSFDIDSVLEYAESVAENLYDEYKDFVKNQVEISARELLSILKKVGYKLQLNNDNDLGDISNLEEIESNEQIRNFFNTFKFITGETAVDILNLSELRKIFRYNKLTFMDVLEILSKEYLNQDNSAVTIETLIDLICILHDKDEDKKQAENLKKEI